MKICYAIRSKFTAPCQESIAAQQMQLEAGQIVSVPLGAGGYSGQVMVTVAADTAAAFEADWTGHDLTRFPARIKAAATALRDCGCTGVFAVSYAAGVLSIHSF